jgi:hypothetical protein
MSTHLVYHRDDEGNGVSPFDERVVSIARDAGLRIACPYLTLSYLSRLVSLATKWRLLTDLEEWLPSLGRDDRRRALDFIQRNREHIRHSPDLHAKVLIGTDAALVGSANFTNRGMTQRNEVSVFFDGEPQVSELCTWFDGTWEQSDEVPITGLPEYVASLPANPIADQNVRLLSSAHPPRRTKLVPLDVPEPHGRNAIVDERVLAERLAVVADKEWLVRYLDLVHLLISHLQIGVDDPRLAMTVPKAKNGWFLPVTINNRYVVAPFCRRGEQLLGVIFGPDFEQRDDIRNLVVRHGRFEALPGEASEATPFFLRIQDAESVLENPQFLQGWLDAAEHELHRASASPYRRFHSPAFFRLVADRTFRDGALNATRAASNGRRRESNRSADRT